MKWQQIILSVQSCAIKKNILGISREVSWQETSLWPVCVLCSEEDSSLCSVDDLLLLFHSTSQTREDNIRGKKSQRKKEEMKAEKEKRRRAEDGGRWKKKGEMVDGQGRVEVGV